jgi:hypothetical protein
MRTHFVDHTAPRRPCLRAPLGALIALTLTAAPAGCDLRKDDDPSTQTPPTVVGTPLPIHCVSTAHADALFGLDDQTVAVSFRPRTGGTSLALLFTDDNGRTFTRPVGSQTGNGGDYRSVVESSTGVFAVDDDYYVSVSGLVGISRLPSGVRPGEDRSSVGDWLVIGERGGDTQDLRGERTTIPLPTGSVPGLLWTIDAQRRVATDDVFIYASHDAGATWQVIGWRGFSRDASLPLTTAAARTDLVILERDASSDYYWVRPGGQPTKLGLRDRAVDIGLFGDQVVYVSQRPSGSHNFVQELVVTSLDGTERRTWPWPADVSSLVRFVEGDDGTLWIYPRQHASADDEIPLMRLTPGPEPTLERIALDLEAAGYGGIVDAIARPDGRLLMSVYPDQPAAGLIGRHFGETMLCEVGPGVTQGVEPIVVEPLSATLDKPGQAVRIARIGEGSSVSDRFFRTPSGLVYATYGGRIRLGPSDVRALDPDLPDVGPNSPRGYSSSTFIEATDELIRAAFWAPSNLIDPPKSQLVSWDPVKRTVVGTDALPFGNEGVFDVQALYGRRYLTTQKGAYSEAELRDVTAPADRTGLPRYAVVGEGQGVLFDDTYQVERGVLARDFPSYLQRFDPLAGRMPGVADCLFTDPLPATCVPIDDADPVAARFAPDGDLYVLDFRHGRVMVLPAGDDDGAGWTTIATGFLTPSDLRLTTVDGALVVMVYDGDLFAFVPQPGVVVNGRATSGSAPSPAAIAADSGARDFKGCLASGPCADPTPIPLAPSGEACVTGERFGDAAGTLLFDGREVAPSRWSDAEICVTVGALATGRDGLLTVVDAAGARSAPVPVHAPSRITSWDIPAVVTPHTVITVRGDNLQDGVGLEVSGALVKSAGSEQIELLLPTGADVQVTLDGENLGGQGINITPEIVRGCTGAASQPCEVIALGLEGTLGTATIGGQAAEVLRWRPPIVTLAWPAGLSPGTHTVTLTSADLTAEGTVTLQAHPTTTLIDEAPFPRALTYRQPRPVWTDFGLLVGGNTFSEYTAQSVIVGVRRSDDGDGGGIVPLQRYMTSFLAGNPLQVLPFGDDTLVFGPNEVHRLRAVSPEDGYIGVAAIWPATGVGGFSGAGVIDGELVAVFRDVANERTLIATVALPAGGAVSVVLTPLTTVAGLFGSGGSASPVTHGAWVTDGGVYLGECHNLTKPPRLSYVPIARDGGGALAAGDEVYVEYGDPNEPLLACATLSDGGVVWVQRKAAGEQILTWRPDATTPVLVATLPATLPGVGQTDSEGRAGVLDVIAGDDGDWLLLLADRESEAHGLRVVRWRASDGTWHEGAPFGTSTRVEPGELCLGPLAANQCGEGLGRLGCAPLACPVRPKGRSSRPAIQPQTGYLTRDPDDAAVVHVIFQVSNLDRTPGYLLGGTEVQHTIVDLP